MHLKLLHFLHLGISLNDADNLRTSKHCNEDMRQRNKKWGKWPKVSNRHFTKEDIQKANDQIKK